jgi:hypothetical protein
MSVTHLAVYVGLYIFASGHTNVEVEIPVGVSLYLWFREYEFHFTVKITG